MVASGVAIANSGNFLFWFFAVTAWCLKGDISPNFGTVEIYPGEKSLVLMESESFLLLNLLKKKSPLFYHSPDLESSYMLLSCLASTDLSALAYLTILFYYLCSAHRELSPIDSNAWLELISSKYLSAFGLLLNPP